MPGLDLLAHQGLIKDVQSKEEGALSSHYLPVQCGQIDRLEASALGFIKSKIVTRSCII